MPVDLEYLKDFGTDRCNREWQRAWVELQLWDVAVKEVHRYLGQRFPQDVEGEAQVALRTLSEKAIVRCRTVEDIVPLLKRIARDGVNSFLRRPRIRHEVRAPENVEVEELPSEGGEDNLERLKDGIAERLHLEGFDHEAFIRFLVRETELNGLEEALLREHIFNHCTQQEFADKYGFPLGSIGGRRERVLRKIRGACGYLR